MSKLTLVATFLALAAGALGGSAYQKASVVETEVHRLHAARSDPDDGTAVEGVEREVSRLSTRVALLEGRARSAAAPPSSTTAAAVAAPAEPPAEPIEKERRSRSPYDLGPMPKDAAEREARKQTVSSAVSAHWKAWGAKHGLSEQQSAALSSLESEAAKQRLDNQASLADGTVTARQTRANNQAVGEDVRRKAQGILTAEQLAQFDADKGGEWGSSYRKIREAEAAAPGGGN
jgi:hypothetical protein